MMFSIVIPVYNVAPYLRSCLDSVRAQTYTDWEAICVDDGSMDGSGAILDEYAAKDARFRVVHKPNSGVSTARNVCIEAACGDYITFLDADDKIDPDWIGTAANRIESGRLDVLRLTAKYWHEDGSVRLDDKIDDAQLSNTEAIVEWSWNHLLDRGWSVVFFVRAELLKGADDSPRFPIGVTVREDTIWCLSLMSRVSRFEQYDYPGYFYRWHSGSACHRSSCRAPTIAFIRQFDELWLNSAKKFSALMTNSMRRKLTRFVFGAVIELYQTGSRADWWSSLEVQSVLAPARTRGDFLPGVIGGRWRIPMFLFLWTGTMRGFVVANVLYRSGAWCKRCFMSAFKGER